MYNLFDPNSITTNSYLFTYCAKQDFPTFPSYIITAINELDNKLKSLGIVNLMLCGGKIRVMSPKSRLEFYPANSSGPWKNIITIPSGDDKSLVVSTMCVLIVLIQQGYIEQVSLGDIDKDQESKALWENAWSIVLSIGERLEIN